MSTSTNPRILQVISSSVPSGAERHVLDLSIHLKHSDYQVHAICPNGWLKNELLSNQISSQTLNFKDQSNILSIKQLYNFIKTYRIDLIHTHLAKATYIGFCAASLAHIPMVSTVHVTKIDPIYKINTLFGNHLIAVSEYTAKQVQAKHISKQKIHVIHNGTDAYKLTPSTSTDIRNSWGIQPNAILIGVLGAVNPNKGQLIAIEAFAELIEKHPSVHLICIGRSTEPYQSLLDTKVKELRLENHITFTGNQSEVIPFIDACDFMLIPSEIESLSIAALEIMSRKKAIVATKAGALPEIIKHQKNGLLVDRNPKAFSKAIESFLDHPELRDQYGQCGHELVVQNYTNEVMTQKAISLYNKLIG